MSDEGVYWFDVEGEWAKGKMPELRVPVISDPFPRWNSEVGDYVLATKSFTWSIYIPGQNVGDMALVFARIRHPVFGVYGARIRVAHDLIDDEPNFQNIIMRMAKSSMDDSIKQGPPGVIPWQVRPS